MNKHQTKPNTPQPPPLPREVYDYFMNELSPLQREIFPLWQRILSTRITIYESVSRRTLQGYQKEYYLLANKWVNMKEKITVIEKLISPDDPEAQKKFAALLLGGYLKILEEHESRIAGMMSSLSGALRDKTTEADFRLATTLSTIAILIGVASFVYHLFN